MTAWIFYLLITFNFRVFYLVVARPSAFRIFERFYLVPTKSTIFYLVAGRYTPSYLSIFRLFEIQNETFPLFHFSFINFSKLILHTFRPEPCTTSFRPRNPLSPTCLPLVSHLSPTCPPVVSHLSPTWLPLVFHLTPTFLALVSHLSPTCLPLVSHLSSTSLPLASHLPPTCLSLVCHLSPTCLPLVSHLLPLVSHLSCFPLVFHLSVSHLSPMCLPLGILELCLLRLVFHLSPSLACLLLCVSHRPSPCFPSCSQDILYIQNFSCVFSE